MASESVVDQIVQSLAFEVEAVPKNDSAELANVSNRTPLNVRIRVKKKGECGMQHGILSVPKFGYPDAVPERIRLISSDQTIMSFDVSMEADFAKNPKRKPRKSFFGGCLGLQYDDDESTYLPSAIYNAKTADGNVSSKSDGVIKQNFSLSKSKYANPESPSHKRKPDILGQCKPGGCLDPPFGEEKYAYEPTLKRKQKREIISIDEESTTHTKIQHLKRIGVVSAPFEKKKSKDSTVFRKPKLKSNDNSILSIYDAKQKSSVDSKYSDSVITYPPDDISPSAISNEKKNRNSATSETKQRKSFNESSEAFFSSPRKTSRFSEKSSNDKVHPKNVKTKTDDYKFQTKTIVSKNEDDIFETNGKPVTSVHDLGSIEDKIKHNVDFLNTKDDDFVTSQKLEEQNDADKNISLSHRSAASDDIIKYNTNVDNASTIVQESNLIKPMFERETLYATENYLKNITESRNSGLLLNQEFNGIIDLQTAKDQISRYPFTAVDTHDAMSNKTEEENSNYYNMKLIDNDNTNVTKNKIDNLDIVRLAAENTAFDSNLSFPSPFGRNEQQNSNQPVIIEESDNDYSAISKIKIAPEDNNLNASHIKSSGEQATLENETSSILSKHSSLKTENNIEVPISNLISYSKRGPIENQLGTKTILTTSNDSMSNNYKPKLMENNLDNETASVLSSIPSDFKKTLSQDIDTKKYGKNVHNSKTTEIQRFSNKSWDDEEENSLFENSPNSKLRDLDKKKDDNMTMDDLTPNKVSDCSTKSLNEADAGDVNHVKDLNNLGPIVSDDKQYFKDDYLPSILEDGDETENDVKTTSDHKYTPSIPKNIGMRYDTSANDMELFTDLYDNAENYLQKNSKIHLNKTASISLSYTRPRETKSDMLVNKPRVPLSSSESIQSNLVSNETSQLKPQINLDVIDKPKEHYRFTSTQGSKSSIKKDIVSLDLAFQSYVNDKKERTLKTMDTSKEVPRFPDDVVTVIQSKLRPNLNEIRVPLDLDNDITIQLKRNRSPIGHVQIIEGKSLTEGGIGTHRQQRDYDLPNFPDLHTTDSLTHEILDKIAGGQVQKVLNVIYEQELVPLQETIKNLKQEIDTIFSQQSVLVEQLCTAIKAKPVRLLRVNPRCGCWRK